MSILGAAFKIVEAIVSKDKAAEAAKRAGLSEFESRPEEIQRRADIGSAGLSRWCSSFPNSPQCKRIDVATPVSITPGQSIQGEQQQLYNYVTKPMPPQVTSAQIAQAEPTRVIMQSQQPTRRVMRRRPVQRIVRKPVRRIVRRGNMKRTTLSRRRVYR